MKMYIHKMNENASLPYRLYEMYINKMHCG